jgi:RND family efflux transporter MFP subunit
MPSHARLARSAGLALGFAALAVATGGCGKPPAPLAPPDAPTVAVRHPAVKDYAPTKEFVGRLVTKDPVKVIPQVSGMLLHRAFQEGDTVEGPVRVFGITVHPGTLLFEIDKVQFEADLNKARADIARADADIKNWIAQTKLAEAELTRADETFKRGAGGKTDLDKAVANLDVAKAQIDVSKAARGSAVAAEAKAAENLRYCTIYAPASGRVGLAKVTDKSIVDAYKTEMVEVFPIDPIYSVCEVDELTSLWYREQIFEKKTIPNPRDKSTPLRCRITLKDGQTYPPPGQPGQPVDYIDPIIDRNTGTRTCRATFPNPDGRLSGGDSVRVFVDAGRPRPVLTIPETAVFAQQRKRYVYVVGTTPEGDKAELREVEPGPSFDGLVVIDKGLTTADRVIVDNLLRVRPGARVQIQQ